VGETESRKEGCLDQANHLTLADTRMNLQRLMDQQPFAFVAIFPIYFLCLWLLVSATVSVIGGWFSLSKVYRTEARFDGPKWRMQSGQMRWLANYNNVLTIGVSQRGLYLASMFLFRFMHPPLFVPWSEIKVRRSKGWMFEYVIFTLGHDLAIPLRIRAKLVAKLRDGELLASGGDVSDPRNHDRKDAV
jgi:hypothetical protein